MLTEGLYAALASMLEGSGPFPGSLFLAVGRGETGWDQVAPDEDRETSSLTDEVARLEVGGEGVEFLDSDGQPTEGPTPRLRFRAELPEGEDLGTLRECGLFAGEATEDVGSGTLIAYYAHPRLDKPADASLVRSVILDLSPRPIAPGTRVTRYLANVRSEELHDLENRASECQVEEIRFDRRCYLTSTEQAQEMGYDFCAYCFGADRSER